MDNGAAELKRIVSKNLAALRQQAGMTQLALGEKLCYSDKAISKWERGDAVPDAYVLKQMSELFHVSVDYLLTEHTGAPEEPVLRPEPEPTLLSAAEDQEKRSNQRSIVAISLIGVWMLALLLFLIFWMLDLIVWQIFLYTVPVSLIVALVLNSIWCVPARRRVTNFVIISILVWSLLLCIALSLPVAFPRSLSLLILGIPAQVILVLCLRLKQHPRRSTEKLKQLQTADKS